MTDPLLPFNSLDELGFSDHFRAQLDDEAVAHDWRPGRVVAQHRGEWDVLTEAGPARAILPGRHYEGQGRPERVRFLVQPTVGDWVLLSKPQAGHLHVIERILTRKSFLERSAAGRRREPQTIVANVDLVVIVCALPAPEGQQAAAGRSIHPRRIERYLAAIAQGGSRGVIALNKADLCPDPGAIASRLKDRLAPHPVITTSATSPAGLTELRALLLPGKTVGFVGLSGVGKSSLVNAILGWSAQRTGTELSGSARGRHTTTHRELFVTEDGFLLVDTPGMRQFALTSDEDELSGFDDVTQVAEDCRFRDCGHRGEPECAVAQAILRGALTKDRVKSYLDLVCELAQQRAATGRTRERPPGGPTHFGRSRSGGRSSAR